MGVGEQCLSKCSLALVENSSSRVGVRFCRLQRGSDTFCEVSSITTLDVDAGLSRHGCIWLFEPSAGVELIELVT